VPALTAFLIKQLQASHAWWMLDISGTPDILTKTLKVVLINLLIFGTFKEV
jgi:hypothetical protein